jgi:preprotein translocase subunit SecG
MSNRAFLIVLVIVAIVVGLAVLFHTPGGAQILRSMHGG